MYRLLLFVNKGYYMVPYASIVITYD